MGCEGLILLLSPAGVRAGESPGVEGGGWGLRGGRESPPTHPKAHWLVFESSLSPSLLCFLMIHFLPNATHASEVSAARRPHPQPSARAHPHQCTQAFPRSVWEPHPLRNMCLPIVGSGLQFASLPPAGPVSSFLRENGGGRPLSLPLAGPIALDQPLGLTPPADQA